MPFFLVKLDRGDGGDGLGGTFASVLVSRSEGGEGEIADGGLGDGG